MPRNPYSLAARNALWWRRGWGSYSQARTQGEGSALRALDQLRTAGGLREASPGQLTYRSRAFDALADLRRHPGQRISDVEARHDIPRGDLRRTMPTAFDERGRVRRGDREAALQRVLGPDGDQLVVVRGSRQRSLAQRHRMDAWRVLDGDLSPEVFRRRYLGRTVAGVELEADPDRLYNLADAGRLGPPEPYPTLEAAA